MTEQEKELICFLKNAMSHPFRDSHGHAEYCASKLIEKFPQILSEKVLCDVPNAETIKDFSSHFRSCAFNNQKIEVFIREVKK